VALKDPEARRRYLHDWHVKNRERQNKRTREYYLLNKEKLDAYQKAYREEHKERHYALQAERQRKVKIAVRAFLGGKCSCCGISEFEFLTIDHVNNDGAKDKKNGIQSSHIYWKILKMLKSFTPRSEVEKTYRLLCFNCNSSKHFGHGKCVHERRPKMVMVEYVGGLK
jgi:hypothetical protein